MKGISLNQLYIASAIKSAFINSFFIFIITFIGLLFFSKNEINELSFHSTLSKIDLEQIVHFILSKNRDGLDLYLINKKVNHGYQSIGITKSVPKNCTNLHEIFICEKEFITVYQQLPLVKNQYFYFSLIKPVHASRNYFYFLSLFFFVFNIFSSYIASIFSRKEIKFQLEALEKNLQESHKVSIIEFNNLKKIITDGLQAKIQQKISNGNIEIIKKLQHDIQSPLTSLEYFFAIAKSYLHEDLRNVGQQSINRIQDIVNTLKFNEENLIIKEKPESEVVALYPVLKRMISEKRVEFKNRSDIEISLESYEKKEIFINLIKSDFSRALSNIINNSIEAKKSEKNLKVSINVVTNLDKITIYISDNGIGIPSEKISEVFDFGKSFNKIKGSGIGLSQAKEYIESENGTIEIESKIDRGTTVIIKLNETPAPTWYIDRINLTSQNIAIIDDDDSIHKLWDEKFSKLNIKTFHFKYSLDFKKWSSNRNLQEYFFLFDLELIGSQQSGLDLIKECSLQSNSILVTSHFMNKDIQNICKNDSIKMIPKESVINLEVINVSPPESEHIEDIILIDNDNLIHSTWKMVAERRNKNVFSYYSVDSFLSDSTKFPKEIKIYVDSDLGDNIRGELKSQEIFNRGFDNIFLTTGHKIDDLPPWIVGLHGKGFPN